MASKLSPKRLAKKVSGAVTKDLGRFGRLVGGNDFGNSLERGSRNLQEPLAEFGAASILPTKRGLKTAGSNVVAGIKRDIKEVAGVNIPPAGSPDEIPVESVSNARAFGNVDYSQSALYGEAVLPGSVKVDEFKKS